MKTPAQLMGLRVGDRVVVTQTVHNYAPKGTILEFTHDDKSHMPRFRVIESAGVDYSHRPLPVYVNLFCIERMETTPMTYCEELEHCEGDMLYVLNMDDATYPYNDSLVILTCDDGSDIPGVRMVLRRRRGVVWQQNAECFLQIGDTLPVTELPPEHWARNLTEWQLEHLEKVYEQLQRNDTY